MNYWTKYFDNMFNEKYFGEVITGYCDAACMDRVRRRLERATELLNDYDLIKTQNI